METLSTEKASHASQGVTRLYDFRLVAQSSEVAVILVHAVHHYINSLIKVHALNTGLFY